MVLSARFLSKPNALWYRVYVSVGERIIFVQLDWRGHRTIFEYSVVDLSSFSGAFSCDRSNCTNWSSIHTLLSIRVDSGLRQIAGEEKEITEYRFASVVVVSLRKSSEQNLKCWTEHWKTPVGCVEIKRDFPLKFFYASVLAYHFRITWNQFKCSLADRAVL